MRDHPSERLAASAPTKSRYAQNCTILPKGSRPPASPAHPRKTQPVMLPVLKNPKAVLFLCYIQAVLGTLCPKFEAAGIEKLRFRSMQPKPAVDGVMAAGSLKVKPAVFHSSVCKAPSLSKCVVVHTGSFAFFQRLVSSSTAVSRYESHGWTGSTRACPSAPGLVTTLHVPAPPHCTVVSRPYPSPWHPSAH